MLLIIIINLCPILTLHAQQFNSYITNIVSPSKIHSDSILVNYKNKLQASISKHDTLQIVNSLIILSTIQRVKLNYSSAFNHSGEALFIAEQSKDTILMAKAHEELGVLYYLFKQDKQAYLHFSQSHNLYKQAYPKKKVSPNRLYRSYYNLILYYQRTQNDAMTMAYIDSCYIIADSIGLNDIYHVYLNEKKAHVYSREMNYDKAIEYLKSSAHTLENLPGHSESAYTNKSFLIIIYSSLANCYRNIGELDLAKSFYQKSLHIKDSYGEHTFFRSFVYLRYASLLYDLGKYQQSYDNLLKAKTINDRYLNPRNESTQGFLLVKDRYSEVLNKKNKQLSLKNLELAKNKQEILRTRIILFITLFILIVIALVVRSRIQHLKHKKENVLNEQKQKQSQELLEHKNKELTATMLHLIEKEEIIKTLSDNMAKTPANKTLLSSIEKQSTSLWEAFNSRFIELNGDFYERLKMRVPDLSVADLKICALIKLNFSGKEMAYLLGISAGSVNVARHRLRKKMNIGREMNLSKFINSI